MLRHFALPIFVILAAISTAQAADKTEAIGPEAEIQKTVVAMEESFNAGDAKALAACWTVEGEFVGPRGERIVGREAIEKAFGEFLAAHKNSKLQLTITSWRLIADDVALVNLHSEMTPYPEGLESEPTSSMTLVKQEGRWLIGDMREAAGYKPSPRVHLRDLDWLIGDWEEETPKTSPVSVHNSCDWTQNGSFLIRKFSISGKKGVALAGTEVIGWDPRQHRIRSWTFDSDGGFGESIWTRDGDSWTVRHTGILANGGDVSAVHRVTPVGGDVIKIQTQEHLINGQKQPESPEFALKRIPDSKPNDSQKPAPLPQKVLP